jgi:hypothetical protein
MKCRARFNVIFGERRCVISVPLIPTKRYSGAKALGGRGCCGNSRRYMMRRSEYDSLEVVELFEGVSGVLEKWLQSGAL